MPESTHDNEPRSKIAQLSSAAKRTARKYLAHLKRNWAGGGKGKAIVAAEMLALLLVVRAIGGGTPQSTSAAPSSQSLGRELAVSVGNRVFSSQDINNVRAFSDDKNHTLTIEFNCAGTYRISGLVPVSGLLVRLFDENGNYLTHFTTKTKFVPTDVWEKVQANERSSNGSWNNKEMLRALEIEGCSVVAVPRQGAGARVSYTVNARDLDYTAQVEVGFTEGEVFLRIPD